MKLKLQFSGPVLTHSGYGVHARQVLKALADSGKFDIAVDSLRWGETPFLSDVEFDWIRDLAAKSTHENPDVAIQVTIPNEFKRRAPLTIGITAGIEVDRVSPAWLLACNSQVDLVIVPSEHSRIAFMVEYQGNDGQKLHLQKPIFVIHEGVDTSVYRPTSALSPILDQMNVPARNFIFTGLGLDKGQGKDRKNVSRLIEYFCKTFAGNQGVGLILKLAIVNGSTLDFELVKRRVSEIKSSVGCGEYPSISVIHGRLPDEKIVEIYNDPRIISAISLTHGEGFGLPLIEAAACGLPVMATDWSGHLDFLTKDGKKLFVPLEHDLTQLPEECVWPGVMEAGSRWATVRETDVCTKLQKMAMSSATPRKWAEELAEHVATRFSLKATGDVLVDLIDRACTQLAAVRPEGQREQLDRIRSEVRAKGPSIIYTMPMSAGDVFLSTGVISALRRKHPGHRVYFATSPQYFDIVKGLPIVDELIQWDAWMQDPSLLEHIFDQVYTPNMNVQMTWANWVHGGAGRNLVDEFAAQCNVTADAPILPETEVESERSAMDPLRVAVHAGGQKSARAWMHWTNLVKNLKANGISVVQVGSKDDLYVGDVSLDLRGQTDHAGLTRMLKTCDLFVGIDSYPMHVAAACGTKVIAIFGSSYAASTGPKQPQISDLELLTSGHLASKRLHVLIETPDRNGCEKACYKDTCRVDSANPCLNNIRPETVFDRIMDSLEKNGKYVDFRPKIAGYTHILNPKTHGYPYVQSIHSMLGFCDEVIVVDGGSTDGSVNDLRAYQETHMALISGQLKVITREWDHEEPGMDGMQKAFGRAMVSPDVDFLWQQDADEIVHEDDYEKIIDICRRFPSDVELVHLPVIELWGDDKTCRTDRHAWKWRLSRNNLRITHGINSSARLTDPKTGRIYAKEGMSDGCEYIDMVTGDFVPHRGFYSKDLEKIRTSNTDEYGKILNEVFGKLPSVWHYSWADLPRKVRNFRDFWDKQWQVLYQTPAKPRFPEVVTDFDIDVTAEQLRCRGGEHGEAKTFTLTKSPPKVME